MTNNFSHFTRWLSTIFAILTLSVGQMWGAVGDELAICQGTGSGYGTRRTLTDGHSIDWVLSTSQSGYLGTNNATNHGKVVPTNADLPVVKAQLSTATISTTGYYFYYTTSAISNVGSIVFSHSATNSNASAAVYVVYSSTAAAASSATWEKVTLSSTSTSAQGANVKNASGGTYTFTFNATQTSAKYYGIIIAVSGAQRFTAGTITIKEGATSQCTNPTTALSVSSSASATVGTPMTLTTANGNGGPVTWEITSGGDKATLDGATLTPTGEGSVTVKATQDDYTTGGKTYCGGNASKTITVTKAVATITLSALGATSSVSGTHYGGDSYTLPTTTTATCTGKVFVGWSRSEIEETDIEPTSNFYAKGEAVTLTAGSNIFYAVFAKAGTPVDASLSASYSSHTGWTETDCCGSSFWVLCTGASLTSPLIDDLSTVSSITLKVRTYGGANYNTVTVKTSSNESVGSADHDNTTLTSKTINVSGLTGSGSLVFTGSATTASYGPGMNDITINYKAATYTKYATTCCTELGSIKGTVSLTQKSADLSWDLASAQNGGKDHIISWKVEYKKDGDAGWTVAESTLAKDTLTKTISNLDCNSDYSFRVSANVENGYCAEAYEDSGKTTQFTITLTGDGTVSGGTFEADETSACDGATITLDATKSTGYNFSTWTISDGSDDITADVLKEGSAATDAIIEITMPEKNIIVTATFVAQHHNVVFHKNDGGEDVTDSQDFTYGVAQNLKTISTIGWTKTNYVFGGWMTDANGSSADKLDGASYTLNAENDVNLYALWVADNTRSISYSEDTHIASYSSKPETVNIDEDDEFSVSFTLDDHYSLNGVAVTMGNEDLDESLISFDQESLTVTAPQGGFTANISVTYTIAATNYTVKFFINNDQQAFSTQSGVYDALLTVPSGDDLNISDCSDASLSFVGWTDEPIGNTPAASKPNIVEVGSTIPGNKNYYAVFAAGDAASSIWEKATTVAAGDYLIVNETGNVAFDGSLSTLDAVGNTIAVTISDGKIEHSEATEAAKFTIAAKTGSYSIKSASNLFIGQTSDANGLKQSETDEYTNTISISGGNADIVCSSAYLRYNSASDQTRFRYYQSSSYSGQKAIQLYKKTIIPDTYNGWVTVCPHCNAVELVTAYGSNPAHGSITLKQGETEVSAPVETCEGSVTINVTETHDTGYQLLAINLEGVDNATYSANNHTITIPQDGDGILTATATFTQVNYTVTMAQTGDADATLSENQSDKHYGDEISISTTTPEGYNFLGWSADPSVTYVENYNASMTSTKFNMPAANVTMTANFQAIPSDPAVVTFSQGAHGTLVCNDCENSTLTEASAGAGITLPSCTPATGYAFLGWTATQNKTTIDDGAVSGATYLPAADMTLYAVYAQLTAVTLKKGNGTTTDDVLYADATTGKVTLPSRSSKNQNYTFAGWSTMHYATEVEDASPSIIVAGEYTPGDDITLYPVFSVQVPVTIWTKKTVAQVDGAGTYAIIDEDGYAFNGTMSSGHGQHATNTFSFTNNVASEAPTGTCELTFTAVEGGYTLYNETYGYLYASKASSGGLSWHADEESYWKINTDNWQYNSNSAYLRVYNHTFRTYGSVSQYAVYFAKKESQNVTKYNAAPANDVAAPTFLPAAGAYYGAQNVTISCETEDVTIYYTDDETTPSDQSTEYTAAFPVSISKTIKAIAIDEDGYSSTVAEAAYTIYPIYNSIAAYQAASAQEAATARVLIDKNNADAIVIGVVGSYSYIQDGTAALVIKRPSAESPWTVGSELDGYVQGTRSTYYGLPMITVADIEHVSTSAGSLPTVQPVSNLNFAGAWSSYAGNLIKVSNVYFQAQATSGDKVDLQDGAEHSGKLYDAIHFLGSAALPLTETACDITGILVAKTENEVTTYYIAPTSTADISTKGAVAQLNVNPIGGADADHAAGIAQGAAVTVTPVEGFATTLNGSAITTVSTVDVTEPTSITVSASRQFYANNEQTYYYVVDESYMPVTVVQPTNVGGSTIAADLTSAQEGNEVTLSYNLANHYHFNGWNVYKTGESGTTVTVTNNKFDMPGYAVTVEAEIEEDAYANVLFADGGATSGNVPEDENKYYVGDEVTMPGKNTLAKSGNTFAGWKYGSDTYNEGDNYTIQAADAEIGGNTITFEAQWDPYPWAGNGKWELVTDASTLAVNDYLIIACPSKTAVAGDIANELMAVETANVAFNADNSALTSIGNAEVLKLGGSAGAWTLSNTSGEKLGAKTVKKLAWDDGTQTWTISIADEENGYKATIQNTTTSPTDYGRMMYNQNNQNPRFTTYTSAESASMILPHLYKFVAGDFFTINYADGKLNPSDAVTNMPEAQVTESDGTTELSDKTPVYVGYTFLRWSDGVNTYNPSDPIGPLTDNITLTAQWEEATPHSLSYDLNGGTIASGEVPSATSYYPYAEVTVTDASLTKEDVIFIGWEYNGDVYGAGSSFTMPNENVVLTAKFAKGAIYTVATAASVTAQGAPEGSSATFVNTYTSNKEQMTGGRSMTLTLSGYKGYLIKNITLSMHANNNDGAGTFSATVGSQSVASIATATTFNKWYDNTTYGTGYRDVHVAMTSYPAVGATDDIVITIAATVNSLYCQSFTIEYAVAPIEINDEESVDASDILPGADVTINNGGTLIIDEEKTLNDITVNEGATVIINETLQANDMTVEAGGVLDVAENKAAEVNNLYIQAEAGASGQVTGAEQVEADGLFMDITLFTSAEGLIDADYWYSVAVPFDVDINTGIYKLVGTTATQLHNSADFDVWYYDTDYRAQSQRTGWKRLSGKMQAGHAYLIGFDEGMSNKVRFKAAEGWKDNLFTGDNLSLVYDDQNSGEHANWNGIANPTMHYIGSDADVQVFNNDNHTYSTFASYNYVVGTAFFVKATSESFAIGNVDVNNEFRAPKRESENKYEFSVRICKGEAERFDNQMYVRASEEASAEFDANRDITTMNNATAPSAMLWTENYGGKRLAIEDAPIVNNTASYVLGLYAPKAGQYRIEATDSYDNADLYLTYEGSIIWNLSMGAYEIELAKGATNGYGLLLQAKAPQVVTGVDEVDAETGVQKIIIDEHVFILRGGQMYDVTGKTVK